VFIIVIKEGQGLRLLTTDRQATDGQAVDRGQRTWRRQSVTNLVTIHHVIKDLLAPAD
jgi:hypothetical protein